jgi:hypothetical protein
MFSGRVFELTRRWQYADLGFEGLSIEVFESLSLGVYCSVGCLRSQREELMAGIPIRPVVVGPVDRCAECSGPVDMTEIHMAIVEEDYILSNDGIDENPALVLAVVCTTCSPYQPYGIPLRPFED